MDNPLKDLKTFVRNPLGLIGLFVTIVYLIASGLLAYGFDKLHGELERFPFILFIVLFPCIILFVFYKLVTKHSNKLYGPSDFQKDESFLEFASRDEVQDNNEQKLKDEMTNVSFMMNSSEKDKNAVKKIDDSSLMQSIVARDAVIVDRLSQKYGIQFYQNMKFRGIRGRVVVDAFAMDNKNQYFIEIKLLRSFTLDEVNGIVNRYVREVKLSNISLHIKYIFALYCAKVPRKDFVQKVHSQQFSEDVDIVFFDNDCNIMPV